MILKNLSHNVFYIGSSSFPGSPPLPAWERGCYWLVILREKLAFPSFTVTLVHSFPFPGFPEHMPFGEFRRRFDILSASQLRNTGPVLDEKKVSLTHHHPGTNKLAATPRVGMPSTVTV